MGKLQYLPPKVVVCSFETERGFAGSPDPVLITRGYKNKSADADFFHGDNHFTQTGTYTEVSGDSWF